MLRNIYKCRVLGVAYRYVHTDKAFRLFFNKEIYF